MPRPWRTRIALVALVGLVTGCASATDEAASPAATTTAPIDGATSAPVSASASRAPAPDEVDGLRRLAYTDGDRLVLQLAGGDVDFLTGVNVGPTVPGTQPGELAITAETWRRWLPMIAGMGFHAVRVYTVQPPRFYDELRAYNLAHPDRPLYLVHGVWIPEEELQASRDLFAPEVREGFHRDIRDAVAVVHGDAVLPDRPGYASGTYTADVSPWLVSWALGIEMDPIATSQSDLANAGRPPYVGELVSSTHDASPTETWLAEALDLVAGLEAERGITVPLTFSNWPTTDPLDHPGEPLAREDQVGIDANHLTVSPRWPGGYYASYHAYPYYPDFQRFEPGIADHVHEGEVDPYAGYLTALREHHAGMPVVVLEYGVPSSIGSAHDGPRDRDQGDHSEQEAMAIDAELLTLQHDLGLAGGFVFEWADEWFKFTWNTIDYELPPNRRQLWHDPLTNESVFGILAIEDAAAPGVVVDGDGADWEAAPSQVVHEADTHVREVAVARDASYLYLRLVLDAPLTASSPALTVAFDVVPGGAGSLPAAPEVTGDAREADTAVVIRSGEARAYVRASNDPNALLYGLARGYGEVDPADVEPYGGVWNEQRLILNRPYTIPTTGEPQAAEWFDLNPLRSGTSDPADPAFDRRVLWAASDAVVELRLPWLMVGFADPSSRQGLVVGRDGTVSTADVERLGITVALGDEVDETAGYTWDRWNGVDWTERPKAGADVLAETVQRLSQPDAESP